MCDMFRMMMAQRGVQIESSGPCSEQWLMKRKVQPCKWTTSRQFLGWLKSELRVLKTQAFSTGVWCCQQMKNWAFEPSTARQLCQTIVKPVEAHHQADDHHFNCPVDTANACLAIQLLWTESLLLLLDVFSQWCTQLTLHQNSLWLDKIECANACFHDWAFRSDKHIATFIPFDSWHGVSSFCNSDVFSVTPLGACKEWAVDWEWQRNKRRGAKLEFDAVVTQVTHTFPWWQKKMSFNKVSHPTMLLIAAEVVFLLNNENHWHFSQFVHCFLCSFFDLSIDCFVKLCSFSSCDQLTSHPFFFSEWTKCDRMKRCEFISLECNVNWMLLVVVIRWWNWKTWRILKACCIWQFMPPITVVEGVALDCNKHFHAIEWECSQTFNDLDDGGEERTVGVVALGPFGDLQGRICWQLTHRQSSSWENVSFHTIENAGRSHQTLEASGKWTKAPSGLEQANLAWCCWSGCIHHGSAQWTCTCNRNH